MKKKAKEREKEGTGEDSNSDPNLIVPSLAKVENKSYKPGKYTIFGLLNVDS